jgi:hypothetical protein
MFNESADKGYTGHKWAGSEYRPNLDVKEIAKRIRVQIKEHIAANKLPKGKYSVVIERFAGGRAINITVKEFEFPILDPEGVRLRQGDPNSGHSIPYYSLIALLTQETLEGLLNAFRMDDSDGMIDYFRTNFYGHVRFNYDLENRERDAILKKVQS